MNLLPHMGFRMMRSLNLTYHNSHLMCIETTSHSCSQLTIPLVKVMAPLVLAANLLFQSGNPYCVYILFHSIYISLLKADIEQAPEIH